MSSDNNSSSNSKVDDIQSFSKELFCTKNQKNNKPNGSGTSSKITKRDINQLVNDCYSDDQSKGYHSNQKTKHTKVSIKEIIFENIEDDSSKSPQKKQTAKTQIKSIQSEIEQLTQKDITQKNSNQYKKKSKVKRNKNKKGSITQFINNQANKQSKDIESINFISLVKNKYFNILLALLFLFFISTLVSQKKEKSPNSTSLENLTIAIDTYYQKNGFFPDKLSNLPEFPKNAVEWPIEYWNIHNTDGLTEFFWIAYDKNDYTIIMRKDNKAWMFEYGKSIRSVPID
ncbi:hypothetical protein [Aliikangiella sp. IMCC44359]|uniref:hypothetical protein n=1 Tax=Aliikangiella sp. IMCC44359 TaxID=3459125 RepID=UPI00403B11E0